MAAGSQTTIIIVAIIGIAAIGGFFLLKRRGAGAAPEAPPEDAGAGDKFWETLPLPGTEAEIGDMPGGGPGLTNINPKKVGVPITGGINFEKAGAFSPLEAGNCQCDDRRCYYYQPYYGKTGGLKEGYGPARKSTEIFYGDKVSACERLLAEFEQESYYTRAHLAKVQRARSSPAAAMYVRARLARTGLA